MVSQIKLTKHFFIILLLGVTFLGAFLILRYPLPFNRQPPVLPTPTPDPIPSDWQIYTNSKYHFNLKYPLDHFSSGTYPNLSFSNLVHQQGFVMGAVGTEHELSSTLWTTLHVVNKADSRINSSDWFMSSIGYSEDVGLIPAGDIHFAYNQSSGRSTPFHAVNMGASILSQFTTSTGVKQFGLSGGGYFIYSSLLDSPSSPYLAILSLIIPVKNQVDPDDWQPVFSETLANYQLMVRSFAWDQPQ